MVGQGTDLVAEIVDDGVGNADAADGTGLAGLRERVEASGGSLTIESPDGAGTRLVAVVPRPTADAEAGRTDTAAASVHP